MPRSRIATTAGIAFSACFSLHVTLAPAADATPSALREEIVRQEEIYRSRGADVPTGYVIDRSLMSYAFVLPIGFRESLAGLVSNDRWLDIGAGEGRAVLDYCTSRYRAEFGMKDAGSKKARAVAMSIEDRRTAKWHQIAASLEPGQVQYLHGRRLREYSRQELGVFQLATDVMGGFSYSRSLSEFMTKTLAVLDLNGSFYSVLQDVLGEKRENRPHYAGAPHLTEIVDPDGSRVTVCEWLKRISCVRVTCELKSEWTPPIEVYHVQKTCENVAVPELDLVHFAAGTPPERRYRLRSSMPLVRDDPTTH